MTEYHVHSFRKERGFYLIGLLIAVAIIGLLILRQMAPGSSQVVHSTERASEAACALNRQTFLTNVIAWRNTHPGQPVTMTNLKQSGVAIPICPAGGELFLSSDDSTVYCTIHAPNTNVAQPSDSRQDPSIRP